MLQEKRLQLITSARDVLVRLYFIRGMKMLLKLVFFLSIYWGRLAYFKQVNGGSESS